MYVFAFERALVGGVAFLEFEVFGFGDELLVDGWVRGVYLFRRTSSVKFKESKFNQSLIGY